MTPLITAIWKYRGFIVGSIQREFQSKYQNSLLGATWTVLSPLATILVYTVVFAEVMRSRLPGVDNNFGYGIYLCAGTITWGYFAEIVSRSQNVFIENANLLKKLNFPRLCLPVIILGNATLNFSIIFSLFIIFLLLSGNFPGLAFFALFPLLLLLALFAIGLGITLGILHVFFRDIGHSLNILLFFWFWLTPIVYPFNALSEKIRAILAWNPMTNLINGFQEILVFGHWPQWQSLSSMALLTILFCTLGFRLFRQHAGDMVDEL